MKWPMVEKRIRELIAADRYLSPKEKAEYSNYVRSKAIREERYKIIEDIRSIVYDHNDFWTQIGDKDKCFELYPIAECWSAFGRGEKSIRTSDGELFVLPALRKVMEQVIRQCASCGACAGYAGNPVRRDCPAHGAHL